jgi:thiamine pyrophosphate-dependent acetolactate synthase large subunit-like protein
MKLTGAQALIKSLEMEGVDVMFGLPSCGTSRAPATWRRAMPT